MRTEPSDPQPLRVRQRQSAARTSALCGPNNPPDPLPYGGGAFPEKSLWDAAGDNLQCFDPEYVELDNVKLHPNQLMGEMLGAAYYTFNLVRIGDCYP